MPPETLERDLAILSRFLHVGFLCLQGGEPLLHPQITRMIEVAQASGMADCYGVLTNGRLLDRQPEEFWEQLSKSRSELRISIYPNLEPHIVPLANEKCSKYGIGFRPTVYNGFLPVFKANPNPQETYDKCPWRRCLTVHEGYFYLCPLSTFFPKEFMKIDEHVDGLPLDGLTESKLSDFLNRKHSLETCRICSPGCGPWQPWSQSKTKKEWNDKAGTIEAIRDLSQTAQPT